MRRFGGFEIVGRHRSLQEHRNRRPLRLFKDAAHLDQDTIRRIELRGLDWPPLQHRSDQGTDPGSYTHGQCTPEGDANCARQHTRSPCARRQGTQDRQEEQRSS